MFVLLLTQVACTGGPPSTADSAGADTGLVPVHGGDPAGFPRVKTLLFGKATTTMDLSTGTSEDAPPSLAVLSVQSSTWLPLLSADNADGCWRRDAIELGGKLADLGDQLTVSVGGTDIFLPDSGRVYEAILKGDDAVAATTAGAAVRLEGQDTTFVVPEAIVVDDLAGSAEALATDTLLHLRWTPSELPGFVEVQAIDHTDSGLWCALEDDGSADIDLGEVAQTAEHLSIGHVARGTFEHATLGNAFVDLERTITVALP